MSIYDIPPNPQDGSNYVDSTTGEIFVYIAGIWHNTFLSNSRPLKWTNDSSFVCRGEIMGAILDDKIFALGLQSIKKSRSLGLIRYIVEDPEEVAVVIMYFNDMFAN